MRPTPHDMEAVTLLDEESLHLDRRRRCSPRTLALAGTLAGVLACTAAYRGQISAARASSGGGGGGLDDVIALNGWRSTRWSPSPSPALRSQTPPQQAAPAAGRAATAGDATPTQSPQALLSAAKAAYSDNVARAFAALTKLTYCGPLPGIYAAAAQTCTTLVGVLSPCTGAQFSVVPGLVRTVVVGSDTEQDFLFGYLARVTNSTGTSPITDGVLIAVRGSVDNLADLQRDKDASLTGDLPGCPGCTVHKGFSTSYSLMSSQIYNLLSELGCKPRTPTGADAGSPPCKVYLTGHASGAAIAALAAWHLNNDGYAVGSSYLFEPPLVGNGKFADAMLQAFSGEPGAAGPIFAVTHGEASMPSWAGQTAYKPLATQANYPDGSSTAQVCVVIPGASCSGTRYSGDSQKDLCAGSSAPDGNFCQLKAHAQQCYGGVPEPITDLLPLPDINLPAQPAESAAVGSLPAIGSAATTPVPTKNGPSAKEYFSTKQLQCVAGLVKLTYCGQTRGLPAAVQSSVGPSCGWGIVPHSVVPFSVDYQYPNVARVDRPIFGYVAMVRTVGDQAPFYMAPESCVVAFRGTMNEQNTALNQDSAPLDLNDTACKGCQVHTGVSNMWTRPSGLGETVVAALARAGCAPAQSADKTQVSAVWAVGHSMGGALATYAMYYLAKQGFNVDLSYSMQGYRPGNQAWLNYLDNKLFPHRTVSLWQTAHARDGIPRWPPSVFSGVHDAWVGRQQFHVWFPDSSLGNYSLCTTPEEIAKNSDCGFYSVPRNQFAQFVMPFADHCFLPFAPDNNVCMNRGPSVQCFTGAGIWR